MEEEACGAGKLAQMCACSSSRARRTSAIVWTYWGNSSLTAALLHIFCPAESSTRDNELLDCLPLFFLSYFPSVCHELFPPQTDKQAGLVARPEGVGSFVLKKFKGKIKEPSLSVNIQYCVWGTDITSTWTMKLYLVSWALSAPHHTCPCCEKDFSHKCFIRDRLLLAQKASKNVNSNFIWTVLASGLNLTKGIKISAVFAAAWAGLSTTKAGSFLYSRKWGDFLVLVFQDPGTRCSKWHWCCVLRCTSMLDLLRDTAFFTFSLSSRDRSKFGMWSMKSMIILAGPAFFFVWNPVLLCVCVLMQVMSFQHGLWYDITAPWRLTHSPFTWPLPLILLFASHRWLNTPRVVIFSK